MPLALRQFVCSDQYHSNYKYPCRSMQHCWSRPRKTALQQEAAAERLHMTVHRDLEWQFQTRINLYLHLLECVQVPAAQRCSVLPNLHSRIRSP